MSRAEDRRLARKMGQKRSPDKKGRRAPIRESVEGHQPIPAPTRKQLKAALKAAEQAQQRSRLQAQGLVIPEAGLLVPQSVAEEVSNGPA